MISIHSLICFVGFGVGQVQSAEIEAVALLSTSRVAPYTDPPIMAMWTKSMSGSRCNGQDFGRTWVHENGGIMVNSVGVETQYACEQLAIAFKKPFYQWNEKKLLCTTCKDTLSVSMNSAWDIYRNPSLWPVKDIAKQCTGKKKNKRPSATSQIDCQDVAESEGVNFYQWNAQKLLCSVSKKCKAQPASANTFTYTNI